MSGVHRLVAAGVLLLAAVSLWLCWPGASLPVATAEERSADVPTEQIARGAYLARVGNCVACHSVPGDAPYSGGRAIDTPFGTVFSSNLTPDDATGLGTWTADAFWRAMHEGRSRDGRLLSPAFPYPNYTRVTREDSDALFAYLRSLPAVARTPSPNTLRFPYNTQAAMRLWRAFYFRAGTFESDPQQPPEWNRGAYLVEGLGHCSACHTPRNSLGGPISAAEHAGGTIPMMGWEAPPLAESPPIDDARVAELVALLSGGISAENVINGPMAEVVFHSLQHLEYADIEAMVHYLRTLPYRGVPRSPRALPVNAATRQRYRVEGQAVYETHCAECHGDSGEGQPYVYPPLAGNRLLLADSPRNAINVLLNGGFAPSTAANPHPYGMPAYANQLNREAVAAVLTYARQTWGNEASAVSPVEVGRD